jgi:hypothetical protein
MFVRWWDLTLCVVGHEVLKIIALHRKVPAFREAFFCYALVSCNGLENAQVGLLLTATIYVYIIRIIEYIIKNYCNI